MSERDELLPFFQMVENKKNWKNPINRLVSASADRDKISKAVIFFTGSVPIFTALRDEKGVIVKYRVQAAGYYVVIGA